MARAPAMSEMEKSSCSRSSMSIASEPVSWIARRSLQSAFRRTRIARLPNHDPYAALKFADFRRLILAYSATTIAREAQIVVVGWQIFAVTNDPLSLGLIGLAEAVPFIAVALYAGH